MWTRSGIEEQLQDKGGKKPDQKSKREKGSTEELEVKIVFIIRVFHGSKPPVAILKVDKNDRIIHSRLVS